MDLAAEAVPFDVGGVRYLLLSLRDIAPGLRVVARAPDGVVEAVEGTGAGFVLGVQCHPEELWERADRRWARVFGGFVEAARS